MDLTQTAGADGPVMRAEIAVTGDTAVDEIDMMTETEATAIDIETIDRTTETEWTEEETTATETETGTDTILETVGIGTTTSAATESGIETDTTESIVGKGVMEPKDKTGTGIPDTSRIEGRCITACTPPRAYFWT